jgi:release factor glutamine methyltransferase
MELDSWLMNAQNQLTAAGINTARLDTLVLLEDCLGKDRAHLLAHPELELSAEQVEVLDEQIERRAEHVPLAYIRHKSEFYGREFYVDERILEPRPESETIITLLKELLIDRRSRPVWQPAKQDRESRKRNISAASSILNKLDSRSDLSTGKSVGNDGDETSLTIIDVGTGSGMLAITAKLAFPEAKVIAIDIDPGCLQVAQQSAESYETAIEFLQGDLLQPLRTTSYEIRNTIILCNLPYVPNDFQINTAATHEPRIAIFGGPDGLDLYRKLFEQIDALETKPTHILTESLPPQHQELAKIAKQYGYKQSKEDDFIQLFTPLSS